MEERLPEFCECGHIFDRRWNGTRCPKCGADTEYQRVSVSTSSDGENRCGLSPALNEDQKLRPSVELEDDHVKELKRDD